MISAFAFPAMVSATGSDEGTEGADQALEISWLGNPAEESWWELELERMFNVTITPNGVGRMDGEAQQIMLAAGEFPDTGAPYLNQFEMLEDGVTQSISRDTLSANAPNFMKAMEYYPGGLNVWRAPETTDEYVGMSGINDGSTLGVFYLGIRSDYIANVGVTLPDYEAKKVPIDEDGKVFYYDDPSITLKWLEDLLIKFRDDDPDGNGVNDTIPYAAYTQGSPWTTWVWGAIYGALDVPNMAISRNQMVDGKLYAAPVSPNFKEFIKLAVRWWEAGLLDPEWFTTNRNTHWELSKTGNYGVYSINRGYTGNQATRTPNTITANLPEGVDFILMAPTGPNGHQHSPMYGTSYVRTQIQVMERSISDAKVDRILQILDTKFAIVDPTPENIDTWMGWRYGKADVHWEWIDEPYKGGFRNISDVSPDYPKIGAFFTAYPNFDPSWYAEWALSKNFARFTQEYERNQFGDKFFPTHRIDAYNETKANDVLERKGEALNTLMSEFFTAALKGDIDVDEAWDDYYQKWLDYGGAEYMAEVAKMPLWEDVYGN